MTENNDHIDSYEVRRGIIDSCDFLDTREEIIYDLFNRRGSSSEESGIVPLEQ